MKTLLATLLILTTVELAAQDYYEEYAAKTLMEETSCLTAGILQGGGSLVGADLEFMLNDHFGAQVGAGLIGFGAGLNYHFKPGIRSSFLSVQYWNQGIGKSFTQSLIGPNYVYRGKKWFTFQIGLGAVLEVGDNDLYDEGKVPDVILTYAIGAYFPW